MYNDIYIIFDLFWNRPLILYISNTFTFGFKENVLRIMFSFAVVDEKWTVPRVAKGRPEFLCLGSRQRRDLFFSVTLCMYHRSPRGSFVIVGEIPFCYNMSNSFFIYIYIYMYYIYIYIYVVYHIKIYIRININILANKYFCKYI